MKREKTPLEELKQDFQRLEAAAKQYFDKVDQLKAKIAKQKEYLSKYKSQG